MYATAADIDATYGTELLDLIADTSGTGARDAAAIDRALNDATATVDGYVSARHSLPLAIVPPLLRALAMDLAIHRLALRPGHMTDEIEARAKEARKTLEAIGAGRSGLGLPSTEPAAQSSNAPVLVASPKRFREYE